MGIKVIDWVSRIVAVLLAIGGSCGQLLFTGIVEPDEFGWQIIIFSVLLWSILYLGLFLAPVVRSKGIVCRFVIAVLMFPSFVLFLLLTIGILIGESYESLSKTVITMKVGLEIIVCSIGFTVYLIQYNLLFKGILFKPIYLRQLTATKKKEIVVSRDMVKGLIKE